MRVNRRRKNRRPVQKVEEPKKSEETPPKKAQQPKKASSLFAKFAAHENAKKAKAVCEARQPEQAKKSEESKK